MEWQLYFVYTLVVVVMIFMGALGLFSLAMLWRAMNPDMVEHHRVIRESRKKWREKEHD